MLRSFAKYFVVFLIAIIISYQYHGYLTQLKLIPTGIINLVYPDKKIKPLVSKKDSEKKEEDFILNANSFEVHVSVVEYFSGYNKNEDGTMNSQHKSAAFYGKYINDETLLELYTRDGFVISKNGTSEFNLPRNYDAHNTQGGIRGIFFIDEEPYAFMATRNIGCQNVSILNLKKGINIFEADCLPDYQKIHYDGIGGASIHNKENILLSIGAPTNNSEIIRNLAQNKKSYYGKVISINKNSVREQLKNKSDIKVEIYTMGHRNIQGLAEIDGNFFSSEHGPKGGDEINLLNYKSNYGWPIASYGTKYESIGIASYKMNHLKNNFVEPLMQFTPSIAISDLVGCTNQMIKHYERKGCLIATTLRDKSLVIVLLSEDYKRVIGYEKIELNERLRHIAKDYKGKIFVEKDGSFYVSADNGEVFRINFKLKKE